MAAVSTNTLWLYRCKKYTTMPIKSIKAYDSEKLISVSIDDFNESIKSGKYIVHYKEVGFFFGIGREELCNCVLESKIGVVDTIFEAAVTLRLAGLKPYLVLNVANDTVEFEERLRQHYHDMGLWSINPRYISDESMDGELLCENYQAKIKNSSKSVRSNSDCDLHPQSILCRQSAYSKAISGEPFNETTQGAELLVSQSKITWNLDDISDIDSYDDNKTDMRGVKAEEDDSKWTWSLDSTQESVVTEPSEHYFNMVRGREYFVQQSLKQQEQYIQLNNERPGLFATSVITDDIEVAVDNLRKICKELFCNWKTHSYDENPMENPVYGKFVRDRVERLLSKLN